MRIRELESDLIRLYLPDNLNELNLSAYSRLIKIKIIYLLSTIYYFTIINRLEYQNYLRLLAKNLAEMVGDRFYSAALQILESGGFIERHNSYLVGSFPKGYRLCRKCYPDRVHWRSQEFNYPNLAKKMAQLKYVEDPESEDSDGLPIFAQKLETENSEPGTGILPLPYAWVRETLLERSTFSQEAYDFLEESTVAKKAGIRKVNRARIFFDAFERKTTSYWTVSATGRFYYPLANCPRIIRSSLLIDGEEAVEVDIGSSQPFFAGTLYEKSDRELGYFLKVYQSDFYETVNQKRSRRIRNKGNLKKAFFKQCFYGGTRNRGKLYEAYQSLFPRLCQLADLHFPPTKKNNSNFAKYLQKMEADCVFKTVEDLRKSGIPCLTVHDSIIVAKSFAPVAKRLLFDRIVERTGMEPIIK